jgi:hypothetical protein
LTIAGLVVMGPDPYREYIGSQLPRVASGEAVAFADSDFATVVNNVSAYGIVPKLRWMGVPGMSQPLASTVAWLYTAVPLALVFLASQVPSTRLGRAEIWLALLNLSSLRSPQSPIYVIAGSLWLLSLLAAEARGRRTWAWGITLAWLLLLGVPPLPWQQALLAASLLPTILCVAVSAWTIIRVRGGQPAARSAA